MGVMLKNIPCSCTQETILNAICEAGFGDDCDFFYAPSSRLSKASNFGYAFLGFKDSEVTARFAKAMAGYRFGGHSGSKKSCVVVPAHTQGIANTLQRFEKK